jgi:hypothetical protein
MHLMASIWFLHECGIKVETHSTDERGVFYKMQLRDGALPLIGTAQVVCSIAALEKQKREFGGRLPLIYG